MPAINVLLDNYNLKDNNTLEKTMCQSQICGHKVEGIDCGAEASEWLSLALGLPNLRLIQQSNCKTKKKGIIIITKIQKFYYHI